MQLRLELLENSLIVIFPELLRCVFSSHSLEDCKSVLVDWTGRNSARDQQIVMMAYSSFRLYQVSQSLTMRSNMATHLDARPEI